MTSEEIIEDLISKDITRVKKSACEIISLSQNQKALFPLLCYISQIKEETKNLEMGGALAPNKRFVDYAIKILEFHENKINCTCDLYIDKYECNNPKSEETKGNIEIKTITRIEEKWIDFYVGQCKKCQQNFKIIEREGHYMWWGWTKI